MYWQYTPYVLPLVFSALVSAGLVIVVWQHRSAAGATPLIFILLAVVVWSAGNTLELGCVDLQAKLFWANVEYLGIVSVPVAWLAFALQYTGREKWLTRRNLAWLAVMPLLTVFLVWTNEAHNLMRSNVRLDADGPFSVVSKTYGPWFWLNMAYAYVVLGLGTVFLMQQFTLSPRLYRGQRVVLALGALLPWVGNVMYIFRLSPIPRLDLTPSTFAFSGLLFVWGLYRYRLLDIMPVARATIIESMQDGVIVLDARNRIVDINPAVQRFIGITASEAIGYPAAQIFSSWPDLIARYRDVTEAKVEIVLPPPHPDNAWPRYLDMHISSLHGGAGQLRGRLIILRDITEYKRVEQDLRQAKDLAEAANRAKSVFLATVTHELRTPLTAIMGFTELLQEKAAESGDADMSTYVDKILAAAHHLLFMINNVLELSRIEAGKAQLSRQVVNVPALVADIAQKARSLAAKNSNVLRVKCPPDIGTLHADIGMVRQALLYLVDNAAKFTQNGTITLSASRQPDPADNGIEWILFSVSDTGIGMTAEQMEHLSEPFWQADSSITRKYGGSGLGLALCYNFCQAMGGHVLVESELGVGSTFTMRLPAFAPI